jgi:hypothetical protein
MMPMHAEDSPFPPYWFGSDRYPHQDLPPVPFPMRGNLEWLLTQPEHQEWAIASDAEQRLRALITEGERAGLPLPPVFIRFMAEVSMQRRIRSMSACYLDLDTGTVPVAGGGRLVRFLADQQDCFYWYLDITEDGTDHAVVCSPEFINSNDASEIEEPDELRFCGEGVETFLCRYWLENEVWFADEEGTPMPAVGGDFIERYRSMP